jgi:outer membrane protein assembly factor BamB
MTAVILAAAAVAGLWFYPNPEFPADYRSFFSLVAVVLAVLVIVVWLLFLSGLRWIERLGILAAVVAVWAGTVRSVEFQGNVIPVFHFRWEPHTRGQHETTAQVRIPEPTPADFPEYRNVHRDGVVTGLTLARDWAARPPKKLWSLAVGLGYGGISVVGPSAVTLEQIDRDEAVVCYDADTGKERWVYRYPAEFRETLGGNGPRTNPTIVGGDVYSLGATGVLVRLDGTTGKEKWKVNVLDGRENIQWGMSGSPLVYDRFVVVNPGANPGPHKDAGAGKAVVAYDRDTGKVAWSAGDRMAGYSSPQLATIAGVRQVLVFDGEGLGSFDPENGKELWFHEWKQSPEVNVAQPLVQIGRAVFISSGYGHGSTMLMVGLADGKWSADEVWTNNRLKCKFTSPVARNGFIYGIDEAAGSLTCLDATTGKLRWKDGRYGNGQILLVGDVILVGTETGKLVLVEARPDEFRELASFQALEGRKNWNYLTVARGRAYVRNHEMMACYELPATKD